MKRRSVFAGKHKNVTKPDITEKEHAHFEINYLDYVAQTHWIHCTPRSGTSDNTKEIETRQRKRDTTINTNLTSSRFLHTTQKMHPTTGSH